MNLFDWGRKNKKTAELPVALDKIELHKIETVQQLPSTEPAQTIEKGGRSALYSVRVRKTFKREILLLQAVLQEERQRNHAAARKVTEGEIIELMLEAFKAARRNGELTGHAVPVPDDVWFGLHQIARRIGVSPAAIFEQLVVEKFVEMNLPLPR